MNIQEIRKSDLKTRLLYAFVPAIIVAGLFSFIASKVGEAIRIISILSVFNTNAALDWTVATPTGIFYGQILTIVAFLFVFIVIFILENPAMDKFKDEEE